jgi:hypothetical protein
VCQDIGILITGNFADVLNYLLFALIIIEVLVTQVVSIFVYHHYASAKFPVINIPMS